MKKTYKNLSALALAGVMIMGMNLTAFAAEEDTNAAAAETIEVGTNNTATLTKAMKIENKDGYVYEPTITYTYTLGNGTAGGTVTDKTDLTVNYKAGDTSYLADPAAVAQDAVFSQENEVTAEDGISSRDLSWTFDPAAFPSAGVYRYTVTETASIAPAEIGIVRDDAYDIEKFLDVYVQNEGDGQIIAGMVLVDDDASVTTASVKSSGWNTAEDLESYTTYNMTITKKITGAGADMTAKFPFTVTLKGEMGHANIVTEGSNGTDFTQFALGENTKETTVKSTLGNNETLTIKGLPTTVEFIVNEENQTADTYKATAAAEGITLTANANGNDLTGNGNLDVASGAIAQAAAFIAITVTNNLDAISPTGVIMRYAPFVLILAAGIVIFALSRRRRDKED